MPKFRKKPVVIEAHRWNGSRENALEIAAWCSGDVLHSPTRLMIHTLEGDMLTDPGDWIIRGVKGEFYPCKPDIFEATYEEANDGARASV